MRADRISAHFLVLGGKPVWFQWRYMPIHRAESLRADIAHGRTLHDRVYLDSLVIAIARGQVREALILCGRIGAVAA